MPLFLVILALSVALGTLLYMLRPYYIVDNDHTVVASSSTRYAVVQYQVVHSFLRVGRIYLHFVSVKAWNSERRYVYVGLCDLNALRIYNIYGDQAVSTWGGSIIKAPSGYSIVEDKKKPLLLE